MKLDLWNFPKRAMEDSTGARIEMESPAAYLLRAIGGSKLQYKFNEACADGFLPCAPQTGQGGDRQFDGTDCITAYIFKKCLDLGLSARVSGKYACAVDGLLRAKKGVFIRARVTISENGDVSAVAVTSPEDMLRASEAAALEFNLDEITTRLGELLDEASASAVEGGWADSKDGAQAARAFARHAKAACRSSTTQKRGSRQGA